MAEPTLADRIIRQDEKILSETQLRNRMVADLVKLTSSQQAATALSWSLNEVQQAVEAHKAA